MIHIWKMVQILNIHIWNPSFKKSDFENCLFFKIVQIWKMFIFKLQKIKTNKWKIGNRKNRKIKKEKKKEKKAQYGLVDTSVSPRVSPLRLATGKIYGLRCYTLLVSGASTPCRLKGRAVGPHFRGPINR